MNVLHGLGDDHETVGKNFLLNFMRRIDLHGVRHIFIYSGMAETKM
jgi:hypothetical protein